MMKMRWKRPIKDNDSLTDSIILQNIVDETNIIAQLKNEGHYIKKDDARFLSPTLQVTSSDTVIILLI
jgi:hypothetical protein